jgi:cytochrome b561
VALAPPAATVAACSRPVGNPLACITHFDLYLFLILIPLAGYLNAGAAGHAVDFFGVVLIPPLLPENDRLLQVAIASHLIAQYPLYFIHRAAHRGCAVPRHHQSDGIIERMLPIRRAG